ncbi:Rv2231c family pyridoxal phosphate-dependent protein CobC [Williamsia sp. CHRR-6]|uniref:Rv2231c family pyridoxal phosphate-dependent protein CobC n=1 Tax=Williamsia sp. CHRR-6 TaxID=2835871 RepID=UPI0035B1E5D5
MTSDELAARGRHGDADVGPGLIDFAVNVRGRTPDWMLAELSCRITDLAHYPTTADHDAAVAAVAARHGRTADEVLLLAGAAEGFSLLPALGCRTAALIQPSFTEPERALLAAGVDVLHVVLDEPWTLAAVATPDDADLVIIGNPTNPTSVLHTREEILALRRPGRIIVVDEAFADVTLGVPTGPGEPQSLAGFAAPDVIVIRSVTKTFALAGLRAGYLLADPAVIARLSSRRPHWPLGTLQLSALSAAASDRGAAYAAHQAQMVAAERESMVAALRARGIEVCGAPAASFVLVRVPHGTEVKHELARRGFAVRSCANFVGLDGDHLRIAVRDAQAVAQLVAAWPS